MFIELNELLQSGWLKIFFFLEVEVISTLVASATLYVMSL